MAQTANTDGESPILFSTKKGKATEAAQAPVTADKAEAAEAQTYTVLRSDDVGKMGYWVDVPLPAYQGLQVAYRTNNRSKVLQERPQLKDTAEVKQLRRTWRERIKEYLAVSPVDLDKRDEAEEARDEAWEAYNAANIAQIVELHRAQCRWLSRLVIGFEGWDFKSDGAPVAEPDPANPDSYFVLYEQFEDLYAWLVDAGYQAALAKSVGNS